MIVAKVLIAATGETFEVEEDVALRIYTTGEIVVMFGIGRYAALAFTTGDKAYAVAGVMPHAEADQQRQRLGERLIHRSEHATMTEAFAAARAKAAELAKESP